MNICYFSCSIKMGGVENVLISLANKLNSAENILVIVPFGCEFKDKFLKSVSIYEYKSYDKRYNLFLYYEIYKVLKAYKIELLHSHGAKASQISYLLSKISKDFIHLATKHNSRKGKIFNKIKYVTAVSKDVANTIDNKNVKIIYNGITPEKDILEKSKNDTFAILAVGRLDKIKGFDKLILEASKLKHNFILNIIGDGEERKNLEGLIEKLNLKDKVKLLGFKKNIPEYMVNSDLVVMSSLSEGFSLVLVESLFYSKVFISTKVSGCNEILSSKLLINEFEIASKIEDIILNYEEYEAEFSMIKDKYQDKFLLSNITSEYINYYKQILSKEV